MIRYPGSKSKILGAILGEFPPDTMLPLFQRPSLEYREPFFGSGAVGFEVLRQLPVRVEKVWINDKDYGLTCLWQAVCHTPGALMKKIENFEPTPELFYKYKAADLSHANGTDPIESGFRKLALHQLSYSGLGYMSGGPLGGRQQSSQYNVNCRWKPGRLQRYVRDRNALLNRFKNVLITGRDWTEMVATAGPDCFMYLDPPYFEKGAQLYKHAMEPREHEKLADALFRTRASWVLSYDNHPEIMRMYEWAQCKPIHLTYTMARAENGGKRRKNNELIITRHPWHQTRDSV